MKKILIPAVATAAVAAGCWYAFLPALNVHSTTFWFFLLVLLALFSVLCFLFGIQPRDSNNIYFVPGMPVRPVSVGLAGRVAKIGFLVLGGLVALLILMGLYSSPIFHAKAYAGYGAALISDGDFKTDVAAVQNGEVTDIAIMDTLTASTLGSRQIGSLGTLATQYELGMFMTTTINGQITKIAPLGYGSFFKWVNSRGSGIPGYVTVDPVVGASEYVELADAIHFSDTGWFSDNVWRKMRFAYPTAVFYDVHFEIDNNGHPYWVAIVDSFKVGLFGCEMPNGVITCDAVTGECVRYLPDEIPDWVSIAYSADDLVRLVNYAGTYTHGYWNSVMAKTDVFRCTDDYGYKVVGENLNAFTGITSAASDQSNIGFVLCDEHTGKIIRYNIYGAEEYSAETAAEGVVLNYGYNASFPSVCNVEGEPVYIMALTDAGNLIKKYAIVDLQDYTKVVVGDTVKQTWQSFVDKYVQGGAAAVPEDAFEAYDVTLSGLVIDPLFAVSGGETYVYLYAKDGATYRITFAENTNGQIALGAKEDSYGLHVTGRAENGVFEAVVRQWDAAPDTAAVPADSAAENAA